MVVLGFLSIFQVWHILWNVYEDFNENIYWYYDIFTLEYSFLRHVPGKTIINGSNSYINMSYIINHAGKKHVKRMLQKYAYMHYYITVSWFVLNAFIAYLLE